ncbi:PTS ascorbate transporter subunit IIC [Corynebacterium pygosceleis]|uniref:PTS ascorbate transporter subunit IIC n=1 Tax=Corynebacterium pygosceleis TaxID=2800406 RepID=UPI0019040B69|nr:PTS ascorbate transporter subunit IIC [Corynebacterium pygosceleis]MCK7674258.1 PTS ascorbate transporter subunit IIC [Corynebacterium pygosceleis]MCL0120444.1 PTS ascorbate transporter subunit IIC [Corynebacterium pygosceleis]
MVVIEFLVNQILSVPAFLIGIITAVGLAALRKSTGEVIGGAVKATLGFLLIGAGAGLVVASLEPLGTMITGATGARGVVPTNEAIVGIAQENYGAQVAWLMVLGFAVSLLLARFTPLHYVFLTGHHVLFMATLITIVLATAGFSAGVTVPLGAVLLGILMVSLPAFVHPWTRRITGDDSIAMGHFGTAGYIVAGGVGSLVGGRKPEKLSPSTENLKLPEGLKFLRDSMVATALSMALMYVILAVIFLVRAGRDEAFTAFEDGASDVGAYLMHSFTLGLQFGVGVAVILFGVRTILGELVPAFQGIAAKFVPGAVPALDCPIVFPYAPNAVLIGFVSSFIGGLVGLALLQVAFNPLFGVVLILPGLVPHFFTGGAAGVYGNATGGRRGAVAGAFANGLFITLGPAFLMQVLGVFSGENTTFGDADFAWFGILIGAAAKTGAVGGTILLLFIGAAILGGAILVQRRVVDTGWDPSPVRTAVPAGSAVGGSPAAPGGASATSGGTGGYPKVAPPEGAPLPPPLREKGAGTTA